MKLNISNCHGFPFCNSFLHFLYCRAQILPVHIIPHICHGRADGVRVNFFWPV